MKYKASQETITDNCTPVNWTTEEKKWINPRGITKAESRRDKKFIQTIDK